MRHEDWVARGLKPARTSHFGSPHHSLRREVARDLALKVDGGRVRENDRGNEFSVDKGSGETGPSSERRVKTKEDKAFGEDTPNPSLISLRPSIDKKSESMFKNIFGLLMEGEGGDGYPCFT